MNAMKDTSLGRNSLNVYHVDAAEGSGIAQGDSSGITSTIYGLHTRQLSTRLSRHALLKKTEWEARYVNADCTLSSVLMFMMDILQ
jgi:hypothetical protein